MTNQEPYATNMHAYKKPVNGEYVHLNTVLQKQTISNHFNVYEADEGHLHSSWHQWMEGKLQGEFRFLLIARKLYFSSVWHCFYPFIEMSYLYVLVLSSQMPHKRDPTMPAVTIVRPILPAFTSSPWEGKHWHFCFHTPHHTSVTFCTLQLSCPGSSGP